MLINNIFKASFKKQKEILSKLNKSNNTKIETQENFNDNNI